MAAAAKRRAAARQIPAAPGSPQRVESSAARAPYLDDERERRRLARILADFAHTTLRFS